MRAGRALVVDDSAAVRQRVARALLRSGEFEAVDECADGLAALQRMAELRPDIVLCDLHMPGCDGLKLLRLRAGLPQLASIPVLMLTSSDSQEQKIDALELGAADYLNKTFHERELLARVRIHYRLRVLQEELEAANLRLTELACTDGLTRLHNRRSLDQILGAELARVLRYGGLLTLVLIDIDHFKRVNDDHGHQEGDRVLQAVAGVLQSTARKADIVARYGGEEMCVLLPSTGAGGATVFAERMRLALERLPFSTEAGVQLRITASFGVAVLESAEPQTAAALLQRADQALYAAKHAGRNRVVLWRPGLAGG